MRHIIWFTHQYIRSTDGNANKDNDIQNCTRDVQVLEKSFFFFRLLLTLFHRNKTNCGHSNTGSNCPILTLVYSRPSATCSRVIDKLHASSVEQTVKEFQLKQAVPDTV